MQRFDGKVALVTGAASGIGSASAERLAREGARVACADVLPEAVAETAKRLQELGAEALPLVCDVSDPGAARSTVQRCVDRFGELHVLCNVAGILHFHHTHELPLEEWNRILSVNLTGTFLMIQAALPHLLRTRGAIVNTASTAALSGHPWTAAYSASKGGVLALSRTLAIEYGRQGLRCNAVCPHALRRGVPRPGGRRRRHRLPGLGRGRTHQRQRAPHRCRHARLTRVQPG
jgi:NAD(P)-dependent dehydrogenase (short-subunit alcohol dehydrogenase family)